MSMRNLTAAEAICEAQAQIFQSDPNAFTIGEGVTDPKAMFGTVKDLHKKFPKQVIEMPVSENAGTGICIGAALNGMKPIIAHMRMDFTLYGADQAINNAAKWSSMFAGRASCSMVMRAIVGRGFGQGIQHAQQLDSMYSHFPGLKVISISNAYNAKGLLIAAVRDKNPVMFIEHRWAHYIVSDVPAPMYEVEIGLGRTALIGNDITIVTWGYMVAVCLKAAEFLAAQGVSAEVIDLQTLRPMDMATIKNSVRKTGRLLVVNDGWKFCGLAGEIIASVCEDHSVSLLSRPARATCPDVYCPPQPTLSKYFYPSERDVVFSAGKILGLNLDIRPVCDYWESYTHDVPNADFRGPF
jgi:pyruvate/2-oxoglutarate/acetoin dehydrogenase E1 component